MPIKVTHYWGARRSGKTTIAMQLIEKFLKQNKKVCYIAHTYHHARELTKSFLQSKKLLKWLPNLTVMGKKMIDTTLRGQQIDVFIIDDAVFDEVYTKPQKFQQDFQAYIKLLLFLFLHNPNVEIYIINTVPFFKQQNNDKSKEG